MKIMFARGVSYILVSAFVASFFVGADDRCCLPGTWDQGIYIYKQIDTPGWGRGAAGIRMKRPRDSQSTKIAIEISPFFLLYNSFIRTVLHTLTCLRVML